MLVVRRRNSFVLLPPSDLVQKSSLMRFPRADRRILTVSVIKRRWPGPIYTISTLLVIRRWLRKCTVSIKTMRARPSTWCRREAVAILRHIRLAADGPVVCESLVAVRCGPYICKSWTLLWRCGDFAFACFAASAGRMPSGNVADRLQDVSRTLVSINQSHARINGVRFMLLMEVLVRVRPLRSKRHGFARRIVAIRGTWCRR